MSAQEQMRNMLDQLMGTQRDGSSKTKLKFSDPQVCRSFLLDCCPHDILQSTRLNLGECPKVHELALRADYEMASKKREYYYEMDAMEHLQAFVRDCDTQTENAKKKLAETQEQLSDEVNEKLDKVHELAEGIGKTLAKAEQLGADGNVEESLTLLEEVERLKKAKHDAEMEYRNSMPSSTYQQQKLRVCEVCSAYLGIHDNDRRLADHFGGKLHLGFIDIREKLEKLKGVVEEKKLKREAEREQRMAEREKEWQEREKEREKSREDYDREREKARNRRRRSRSRSRERRRRSRSRDRRRRSRSRSRSDRTRRRRSRSRSHGRSSSSRSQRRRSRSREPSPSDDRQESANRKESPSSGANNEGGGDNSSP